MICLVFALLLALSRPLVGRLAEPRRKAASLAAGLWAAALWLGTGLCAPGAPLQSVWLLGVTGLGLGLAWRTAFTPSETLRRSGPAMAVLGLYLAADLAVLVQTGAGDPLPRLIGLTILALLSPRLLRIPDRRTAAAAALLAAAGTWGLLTLLDHTGTLALFAVPAAQYQNYLPPLDLPPARLALLALAWAAVLRVPGTSPGFVVAAFGCALLAAQAGSAPLLGCAGIALGLVALLRGSTAWAARAVTALLLLALPLQIYAGFLLYAVRVGPSSPHTLFQSYGLARLAEGEVVEGPRLARLFPADVVSLSAPPGLKRLAFPGIAATAMRMPEPAWLVYSNNPEFDFRGSETVLSREAVPAGPGRVFASHFNVSSTARDLVVELYNPGPLPARLDLGRFASVAQNRFPQGDAGLELWRRWLADASEPRMVTLAPGAGQRLAVAGVLGNGMMMADLRSDRDLVATTAWLEGPEPAPLQGLPHARVGGQSRGLFSRPDVAVEGRFDPEGGARVWHFAGPWMRGADHASNPPVQEELKGDYGGVVDVQLRVSPGTEHRRVLALLVSAGGALGALHGGEARTLKARDALVLWNRSVPTESDFRTRFSLPANSFAPAWLLLVPLRG